jgi:hypothetical protein
MERSRLLSFGLLMHVASEIAQVVLSKLINLNLIIGSRSAEACFSSP